MNERVFSVLTGEMVDTLRDVLELDNGTTLDQIKEKVLQGEMSPEVRNVLNQAMTDTVHNHRQRNTQGKDRFVRTKSNVKQLN